MSGILNAIGISSRGLSVQRAKMNTVAQNMANAETTQTEEGGPYRRKRVLVSEQPEAGLFKSIRMIRIVHQSVGRLGILFDLDVSRRNLGIASYCNRLSTDMP